MTYVLGYFLIGGGVAMCWLAWRLHRPSLPHPDPDSRLWRNRWGQRQADIYHLPKRWGKS